MILNLKVCKMNGGGWDRPDQLSPSLTHTPVSYTHLDVYKRQGFSYFLTLRRLK